ncbi:MAG: S41 family peptidase [Candidatus Amoebophilus sp.]
MVNKAKSQPVPIKKTVWGVLTIVILMSTSFFLGRYLTVKATNKDNLSLSQLTTATKANQAGFNEKLFWEVWQIVANTYVDKDKVDNDALFHGALKGLVEATHDPYSLYMTPKEQEQFASDMSGKFEGIGAEIGLKDDIITVISPLEGMPAEKAGLQAGDQIAKIDDATTMGFSVMEAVDKIRGSKGTKVKLTVLREGENQPLDITITRDVIAIKSVKTEITKDNIFIVRVSSFNDDTDQLFTDAVDEILAKKPKGIILDLRNNPGGYLESAIFMASKWIKNDTVVMERYGDGTTNSQTSVGEPVLSSFKTMVLINRGSDSASEIVAGALQDHNLATIIGEKSFGKGSVQVLRDLSDGGSVKITAAKWLTPKGKSIDGQGITPDIKVTTKIDSKVDQVKQKAIDLINN